MRKAAGGVRSRENKEVTNRPRSFRKKIKRSAWADLPQELLDVISKDLNIADYLSFGRVCRSWRLFYSEYKNSFMALQSPLVIYISTRSKLSCYFYDLNRHKLKRYKTKLPTFASNFKFCIGVSSGYLIMKDLFSSYFWLINPVTGHQLNFSRMPDPPNRYGSRSCNDRAIFASIGSQDQDFLIMIHSKELRSLQFCRSKDNQWKDYSYSGKPWRILDMVVFHGRIFVITDNSQIGMLDLRSSELIFLKLKNVAPRLRSNVRLVASEKLLLIVEFDFWQPVKVHGINFSKMEWFEVDNLGDHALFLGKNNMMWSKLINPKKWGGPSNCIYHLSEYHHSCDIYSLNGEFLKTFIAVTEDFFPRTYSWYFLPESNSSIDNVKNY